MSTKDRVDHRETYASLVGAYVDTGDERFLLEAASLGQELVKRQVPTEVIGELHHHALTQLARSHPHLTLGQVNERVTEPLMELLMAYGLDFRERLASTEQELQEKVAELARANRAKRVFLANMSHEIRTPLNGVLGVSWLLQDSALDDEQQQLVRIIQDSGKALLGIIDDILDYSKIEANQLLLEREPFSVRQCLETSLQLVAIRARGNGLTIGYVIDPGVPATIVGDVTRLRQILLNLLSNAIKFSQQGEVVVEVSGLDEPSTGEKEGEPEDEVTLQFAVHDEGTGIAEDRLDAVFESFRQADESTTRKYGGTGLGLAICKQLVGLMGGEIGVRSELGRGSTFHFTIRARLSQAPLPEHERIEQPALAGRTLLLVSEQSIHQRALESFARCWQMNLVCVPSGLQAQAVVADEESVYAVIVDSSAPGVEAILATAARTGVPPLGDVPIVGLRWVGSRDLRQHAHLIGDFLAAPLAMASVYESLHNLGTERDGRSLRRGRLAARGTQPPEGRSLRVLMVEDNQINRKLGVAILERLGHRTDTAEHGQEALDKLRVARYDVVFMDVHMPVMNGVDATRRIREEWPDDDQPLIVALTANVASEDKARFLAAGMDGFLGKPIQVSALKWVLERAAHRKSACNSREQVETTLDADMRARLQMLMRRARGPEQRDPGGPEPAHLSAVTPGELDGESSL